MKGVLRTTRLVGQQLQVENTHLGKWLALPFRRFRKGAVVVTLIIGVHGTSRSRVCATKSIFVIFSASRLLAPHNCAPPDQPSKKKKSASKTGDAGGVGTIFKEGDPLYFKMQGNDAFMKGDFAAAVTSYGQAIGDDPTNHVLYSNRAAANIEIGDADALAAAVQDADKCIELEAEWAKGYFRKGCALRAMGLPDQAEVALTTGLRLQPSNQDIETALLDLAECQRLSDIQEGKQDKFTALVNWLLDAGAKFPKLFMEGCVLRAPALLCSGRKRAQHCSLAAALQQHCSTAAAMQSCVLAWPWPWPCDNTRAGERAGGRTSAPPDPRLPVPSRSDRVTTARPPVYNQVHREPPRRALPRERRSR